MKNKAPFNFGGIAKQFSDYKRAKAVILPVPFDKTSTWLQGTNKGPRAIIDASRNMELYDVETGSEVYKQGIFTEKEIRAVNSAEMLDKVYKKAEKFLGDEKFVVSLGGEHSISLGVIKAYSEFFNNLSILHLDAHADSRDFYDGSKYNHSCVMARAKEFVRNVISVGVRSMDSSEIANVDKNKIFFAYQIYNSRNWFKKSISKLSKNVYITLDLDVFDTDIMPSVGTPEPGGLGWYQVLEFLKSVFKKRNVVGFDAVELCPSKNKAPDFLAAKLIYILLGYKFS
jgi:agmatinase